MIRKGKLLWGQVLKRPVFCDTGRYMAAFVHPDVPLIILLLIMLGFKGYRCRKVEIDPY